MKTGKFLSFTLLGLLAFAPAALADSEVTITSYAFAPASITVPAGTKVTWTNKDDTPHTIVDNGKKYRSPALDTKDTYSHTYAEPGTYHYFCTLHPQMTGTIVVTAAADKPAK